MKTLTKIGIGICIYFTLISIFPLLFYRIELIGYLSPFPQNVGHITGDIYATLWATIIFVTGLVGLIIFISSKTKRTIGLQVLLILVFLNCVINLWLLSINTISNDLMGYFYNSIISLICIGGIVQLYKHRTKYKLMNKTPTNK